jgi:hypothetical protein
MISIIAYLIAAAPLFIFASLCGLTVFSLLTDKKRKQKFGQYYNHPDKTMPLYNKGHCDRYSAGTFTW